MFYIVFLSIYQGFHLKIIYCVTVYRDILSGSQFEDVINFRISGLIFLVLKNSSHAEVNCTAVLYRII